MSSRKESYRLAVSSSVEKSPFVGAVGPVNERLGIRDNLFEEVCEDEGGWFSGRSSKN